MDLIENCIKINAVQYTLKGIEELAWKKIVNGSIKKKDSFRTMCVGTIGVGSYPFDDATVSVPDSNHFNSEYGQNAWIAEIGDANVGIYENETSNFHIYPNPTNSMLNISGASNMEIVSIELLDFSGKLLVSKKVDHYKVHEVDLSTFSSGIYFINILTKTGKHENYKISIVK